MKKNFYLLLPIAFLLILGSFVMPARATTINDPQDDIIGIRTWEENGESKFDCEWVPPDASMIDIQTISWIESGPNYTITMTFYGTPSDGLLQDGTVMVNLFFLINGSTFADDINTETPEAHLTISAADDGTVIGNETTIQTGIMSLSAHSLIWSFPLTIAPVTPVALDNWDLMAFSMNGYDETIENITYNYAALDHYNFDYLEDTLTAICTLLNIPGYSLIAVGVVAVITIGVIIKKKYKN
jgi:hypothetical protein